VNKKNIPRLMMCVRVLARNSLCMIAMPCLLQFLPQPPSAIAREAEPEEKRNSEREKYNDIDPDQKIYVLSRFGKNWLLIDS
jgi:hypothetical protein